MDAAFYFTVCFIKWLAPVHDGPVTVMTKSPFLEHLLLTMGGYSFAVWNEGIMVSMEKRTLALKSQLLISTGCLNSKFILEMIEKQISRNFENL